MSIKQRFHKYLPLLEETVEGNVFMDLKNPKLYKKLIRYYDNEGVEFYNDPNDYALPLMIEKSLDKDGSRLFQEGDKASLRREVEANILQEIQLAMIEAGQTRGVEEAKAELKS